MTQAVAAGEHRPLRVRQNEPAQNKEQVDTEIAVAQEGLHGERACRHAQRKMVQHHQGRGAATQPGQAPDLALAEWPPVR